MLALVIIGALLLDYAVGEPNRGHPLVGFGHCASWLESRVNLAGINYRYLFLLGTFGLIVLVIPAALMVLYLKIVLQKNWGNYAIILDLVVVYWAIGLHSLNQHIKPIQRALLNSDISLARELVSQVTSRDSTHMEPREITSATIETTIENGCDTLFSILFWYSIGGVITVVIYRLVNTLDAMWGYRTERFEYFGKAAAKSDDLLNYIPARLTALTYSISGDLKRALNSWQNDARQLDSPNAGPVMTAGAGSLNVRLGGDAIYHGRIKHKPYFGGSELPVPSDISRALRLVNFSAVLWCVIILAITLFDIAATV